VIVIVGTSEGTGVLVGSIAVGALVGGEISAVGTAAALVGAADGSACPHADSTNPKHPIKNTILRMCNSLVQ
jgi:hypothetical protein